MIPEKYKNYMFNENDYLPQEYHVDDPEKLKYLKIAAAMISDDIRKRSRTTRLISGCWTDC